MSSDASAARESASVRDRVQERLEAHLSPSTYREATVETVDAETGTVVLSFGCGCSGGISGPERAEVRRTLVEDLSSVDAVRFGSGCGCGGASRGHGHGRSRANSSPRHHAGDADDSDGPQAPF